MLAIMGLGTRLSPRRNAGLVKRPPHAAFAPHLAENPRKCAGPLRLVMAGLDPAIHLLRKNFLRWTRGSSPRVTGGAGARRTVADWVGRAVAKTRRRGVPQTPE